MMNELKKDNMIKEEDNKLVERCVRAGILPEHLTLIAEETHAIQNRPNGRDIFRSSAGHFPRLVHIMAEFVDNAVSNIAAHQLGAPRNVIEITIKDELIHKIITVRDYGTGIQDINHALTFADRSVGETTMNAFGVGLKHALASMDATEDQMWSICTVTAEDAAAHRVRIVTGPYHTDEEQPMQCYAAEDPNAVEGTAVTTRCTNDKFDTIIPDGKYEEYTFWEKLEVLEEALRVIYAPLLEDGRIQICLKGIGEEDGQPYELCHMLTPLNPLWEEGTMQVREVKVDLGGGPLTIRYRYGRIIGNEENMLYYMGNLETSGAEIRVNGRLLCSGLQREIWGRRGHPDYNHFLVQVDLHSENAAALPETETTKTGFQTGTRMFRTLKRWLKRSVILPKNTHRQRERELVNLLEEKMKARSEVLNTEQQKIVLRSEGLQLKPDLFVNTADGAEVYEAKLNKSNYQNLNQLRLYWDGCAVDGIALKEGVLIAAKHDNKVSRLMEDMNRWTDPTGRRYNFRLVTWEEEGIDASEKVRVAETA